MQIDTLVIGAGAAGMMCAAHAGGRVMVVDHAKAPGEKIRISGGGRCNFTNMYCSPDAFLSANPHFAKSALARYTQWDFIDLVDRHGIPWHEKTLGQLFCDTSAKDIVAMLRDLMQAAGVDLRLKTSVRDIQRSGEGFRVALEDDSGAVSVEARHVVLASGGKSIPKMGATGLAYDIARQFGLAVTDTRPALVPFTFASHAQGKRKSSKPPPKKVAPKVDTMFTCPFCNHDKAVTAKMDHLTEKGLVECTVCGQKYTCNITHLSEPIDVYSDWIDACDKANKEDAEEAKEEDDL